MRVKAISLWQPWASLMAIGAKKIETRGYPTKVRGLVAIHAAKRWTAEQRQLTTLPVVTDAVRFHMREKTDPAYPLGCIVAVGELVACKLIVASFPPAESYTAVYDATRMIPPSEPERSFGNYEPGRYAWIFENVRAIEPIPCKGKQGWFNMEIPTLRQCDGCGAPSETGCACG